MAFTSFEYYLFLPIVFLLYWLVFNKDKQWQNICLLAASLFFYGWWDWRFLGLLLLTAFSTYLGGLWMGRCKEKRKRWWVSFGVILLNVGILVYYKYTLFFIQSFVDAFRLFGQELSVSTLRIILPVGISFYTFTALSYNIDVYQKKIEPTKDVLAYLAYVTFFPAILSGPISRATKQLPQFFEKRTFKYEVAVKGLQMILWGLFMKLCVADRLGIYVDAVYANLAQHNGTTLLFASILYTLQIYCDFAGYSLMAIGGGQIIWYRASNKLYPSIFCQDCNRLLEKMAYFIDHMVSRLYLFPARRKPSIETTMDHEYHGGISGEWGMAWSSL